MAESGFPLTSSELDQARSRIADRLSRRRIGWIERREITMPCPKCKATIITGSAYCSFCGSTLYLRGARPMAFLCHSSADKAFVLRLANTLRGQDITVFLDEWDIQIGDSIQNKIEEGIRASDYFIVILSEKSVTSSWVDRELRAALSLTSERSRRFILPALIEQCEIPLFLRDLRYADFRRDYGREVDLLRRSILGRPG